MAISKPQQLMIKQREDEDERIARSVRSNSGGSNSKYESDMLERVENIESRK